MKTTTTQTSTGKLVHEVYVSGYEEWRTYDSNNNLIHRRNSRGYELWKTYDSKNNLIHWRNSDGYEEWCTYDSKNNPIHWRNSRGYEEWYDENGRSIPKPQETSFMSLTQSTYENIATAISNPASNYIRENQQYKELIAKLAEEFLVKHLGSLSPEVAKQLTNELVKKLYLVGLEE